MACFRSLLLLLLCGSLASAADSVKLRTLDGKAHEGSLQAIDASGVKIVEKGASVTTAFAKIQDVDFGAAAAPNEAKYSDIELIDGSLLHCTQFAIKNKDIEAKLAGGLEVKFPLSAVNYILKEAQEAKVRSDWLDMYAKRTSSDILAIRDAEGNVNGLEGTLGEGDDKGETIGFETAGGTKRRPPLERIHALGFLRKLTAATPDPICKAFDTSRNAFSAAKVSLDGTNLKITTVSGVALTLPQTAVGRLDFSKGKLVFLSDIEPAKAIERSSSGLVEHFRRDKNLDGGVLKIGKETYEKGLTLHAYTELIYDIAGQYKEFKTTIGVDPSATGPGRVKITIEGDGRSLYAGEMERKDPPRPLALDVKNVKQLRIVVATGEGLLDLGEQATLADAKVSK